MARIKAARTVRRDKFLAKCWLTREANQAINPPAIRMAMI
jgi:hypothetical protein